MAEQTRLLSNLTPLPDGGWEFSSITTPVTFTIRGLVLLPSNKVIPVIVVPGIMGTNLRAKIHPRSEDERNQVVKPGQEAWRPPNTQVGGLLEAARWTPRTPKARQQLLDGDTLEVDGGGPIEIPRNTQGFYPMAEDEGRQRGWGEVHADSYGALLYALETRLNHTFQFVAGRGDKIRAIRQHWKDLMACDPQKWGVRQMEPLTEADLEKHAQYYYPVYACGYNWLEDCEKSSQRLEKRVLEIIEFWKKQKSQCEQAILVTHSMGGLVARACAKRIPDKIAGVIHGVMPALGAPACYRRIACGTEANSPSNGWVENIAGAVFAEIAGETTAETTPVMATAPGPLELLPNHLYPRPWLHVRLAQPGPPGKREAAFDYLHLPNESQPNPYDLYRDMASWYRLINPALADPAGKFKNEPGGLLEAIKTAIDTAERFHRSLGDYYHPSTYAFYGNDTGKLSFGQVRWVAQRPLGSEVAYTTANLTKAQFLGYTEEGGRRVRVAGKTELHFEPEPQNISGDGTVPRQSGAGPAGKVKQLFETRGYSHQGSYNNDDMLMLTLRLIVKIVQEMPCNITVKASGPGF